MDDARVSTLRGQDIAMIFQDPLSALHPYYTVGKADLEAFRVHHPRAGRTEPAHAVDMLDRVGIPRARQAVEPIPASNSPAVCGNG